MSNSHADKAVFAGGCFWCVEAAYQDVDGVTDAVSGFIGGALKNPTYSGNHKGHYEAVEITYDPAIISYQQLLDLFWINIDPFDSNTIYFGSQFVHKSTDKGLTWEIISPDLTTNDPDLHITMRGFRAWGRWGSSDWRARY